MDSKTIIQSHCRFIQMVNYSIILFLSLLCFIIRFSFIQECIFLFFEGVVKHQINRELYKRLFFLLSNFGFLVMLCLFILFFISYNTDKVYNVIIYSKKILSENNRVTKSIKLFCGFFVVYSLIFYLNPFVLGIDLPVFSTGLDNSYIWALSNISRGNLFVWGRDITFTYGPYGFLFWGQRYIISFLFSLFILLLIISLFLLNYFKGNISLKKAFFFFLVIFAFSQIEVFFEWRFNLALFFFFCTFYTILDDKNLFCLFSFISGLLCSFSLLLKFNTGILALGLAVMLGLCMFIQRKKGLLKYFIFFSIGYLLFLIINIYCHFNNLNNFLLWLRMSIEIAKGFSESMVIIGNKVYLFYAALIILLYLLALFPVKKIDNRKIIIKFFPVYTFIDKNISLLLGLIILFFSFKHGFVRQDIHIINFFSCNIFFAGYIYLFSNNELSKKHFILSITFCLICFLALTSSYTIDFFKRNSFEIIKNRYSQITGFKERTKSLDNMKKAVLGSHILSSEWNDIIANNTIQILPWELSYAFANNWQGWIPNPVLQLYSAYTEKLDEYSSYSFSEKRAPRFLLLEYKTIDYRNMFLDTPETWNAILYNYEIVKSDNSRLLLERKNVYNKSNLVQIESNTCSFNEKITIPASDYHVYAKISIKQSFLGKIITTLFRGSPPMIKLKFQSGDEIVYRVISDTLKNPVLIDTIPGNFQQMKDFFEGKIKDYNFVEEISFMNEFPLMFKNKIKIDWFHSQRYVNKVNYIYSAITELSVSKDTELLLKQYTYDIVSVDLNEEKNIVLECGIIDPQLNVPLQPSISRPFVQEVVIELVIQSNTKFGYLQVFYDYGNGLSEKNSVRYGISAAIDEKVIRLPIVGWEEGAYLVGIRIDPPDGSKFVIKNINILSKEEITN